MSQGEQPPTPAKPRLNRRRLALAIIVALAALVWVFARKAPPQIITAENGQQYRFAGATYGTNHVQGPWLARFSSHLPKSFETFLRKRLGNRVSQLVHYNTDTPELVVWLERIGTNAPAVNGGQYWEFSALLAYKEDELAAAGAKIDSAFGGPWAAIPFKLVPRRSKVLYCFFLMPGTDHPPRINFPNPLYGRFPQWQPEPVPAVKRSDNLEVRLKKVSPGYGSGYTYVNLDIHSPEITNAVWHLHSAELSDATGNRICGLADRGELGERIEHGGFYLPGALWPDETAWRLRLEFKRTNDFPSEELVTFKNVRLLSAGVMTLQTNTAGGIPVVLKEFINMPRFEMYKGSLGNYNGPASVGYSAESVAEYLKMPKFTIGIPGDPDDFVFDIVRIISTSGEPLNAENVTDSYADETPDRVAPPGLFRLRTDRFVALKHVPAGVQTVDITWAVQKTRTVDFFVKPQNPKGEDAK